MKRVFLIVLDSVGIGEEPDAAAFGDVGAHTMKRISASPLFCADTLKSLGLAHIDGQSYLGPTGAPRAAVARLRELSNGKDTTIGHWEIAGLLSKTALPTFPDGFPEAVLAPFRAATGRGVLCNRPYSGTDVIRDFGKQHLDTGDLIVYTSADSVFQIAAHEAVVPPEELYAICRQARAILQGPYAVGRVIARPFIGDSPKTFTRTANRHDFSLEPQGRTLLDALKEAGHAVIAVGKITDIFAGRGITETHFTHGNAEGMARMDELAGRDFDGLCFVNLVDFDMLYGHRQDVDGYAGALATFDRWLSGFLPRLRENDVLMITADHGCDPGDNSTDHTREYTPLLVYGQGIRPGNYGTCASFSTIAATIADWFGVPLDTAGKSLAPRLIKQPTQEEPS